MQVKQWFVLILAFVCCSSFSSFAGPPLDTSPLFPKLSKGDTLVYQVKLDMNMEMEGAMGQQTMDMPIEYQVTIAVVEHYRPDSLRIMVRYAHFKLPEEMSAMMPSSTNATITAQYSVTPGDVQLVDTVQGAGQNPMLAQMLRTGSLLGQQIFPPFPVDLLAKGEVTHKAGKGFFRMNADSVSGMVTWKVLKKIADEVLIQFKAEELTIKGDQNQHGMQMHMEGTVSAEQTYTVRLPEAVVERVQGSSTVDMDISVEGQMQMASTVYNETQVNIQLLRYQKAK